jgi:hypothetical protein
MPLQFLFDGAAAMTQQKYTVGVAYIQWNIETTWVEGDVPRNHQDESVR